VQSQRVSIYFWRGDFAQSEGGNSNEDIGRKGGIQALSSKNGVKM